MGKSFGCIQEVLDQIGAFLGPVLLYLVMLFKTDGTVFQIYSACFAVLAVPSVITIVLLLVTVGYRFPNPGMRFEPESKRVSVPVQNEEGVHPLYCRDSGSLPLDLSTIPLA
ncbi:MAG: hypothetical protein ACLU9S_09960 [Oscillospiraceae bacterium]